MENKKGWIIGVADYAITPAKRQITPLRQNYATEPNNSLYHQTTEDFISFAPLWRKSFNSGKFCHLFDREDKKKKVR